MIPTDEQWAAKLAKKEDATDGKVWFREAAVKENTEELAMVCPCVPFWAYEAFTEDVPAHVLWERIHTVDDEDCKAVMEYKDCKAVMEYTKNWLKALHTAHNATRTVQKVEIDSRYFMERPSATSSEWLRKRVATLYPSVVSTAGAAGNPGSQGAGNGTNNALQILAQALAVGNNPSNSAQAITSTLVSSSANYDKFGMSDGDVDRMCILCGLKPGQGAGLPSWFTKINEKGTGKDGQRTLLRKLFSVNLKYEEQPIPCTPSVLDMIMKKVFTGDGDYQTTTGVMKGISPFLFAPQSAEEIADATMYAEAVSTSTSTTVDELQKLCKKAKAPQSITTLINLLKSLEMCLKNYSQLDAHY